MKIGHQYNPTWLWWYSTDSNRRVENVWSCWLLDASFEAFTAVKFQFDVLWVVTPCSVVLGNTTTTLHGVTTQRISTCDCWLVDEILGRKLYLLTRPVIISCKHTQSLWSIGTEEYRVNYDTFTKPDTLLHFRTQTVRLIKSFTCMFVFSWNTFSNMIYFHGSRYERYATAVISLYLLISYNQQQQYRKLVKRKQQNNYSETLYDKRK